MPLMRKKKKFILADLDRGRREGDKLRNKAIGVQSRAVCGCSLQLHLRGDRPSLISQRTPLPPYWVDFIRESKGLAV